MNSAKTLLIASILNALFFAWIYITHVYEITWTIAGVFHELLMIPMILLAPVILIVSLFHIVKRKLQIENLVSLVISVAITFIIVFFFSIDLK